VGGNLDGNAEMKSHEMRTEKTRKCGVRDAFKEGTLLKEYEY
jgi:hypothetical protein